MTLPMLTATDVCVLSSFLCSLSLGCAGSATEATEAAAVTTAASAIAATREQKQAITACSTTGRYRGVFADLQFAHITTHAFRSFFVITYLWLTFLPHSASVGFPSVDFCVTQLWVGFPLRSAPVRFPGVGSLLVLVPLAQLSALVRWPACLGASCSGAACLQLGVLPARG